MGEAECKLKESEMNIASMKVSLLAIFMDTDPVVLSPYALTGNKPMWLVAEIDGKQLYATPEKVMVTNRYPSYEEVGVSIQWAKDGVWISQGVSMSFDQFENSYPKIMFVRGFAPNIKVDRISLRNSDQFNYQLLSQLKMDCDHYLGHGNRSKKYLRSGNEVDQIKKMRELYDGFSEKPEWLTLNDIARYEAAMIPVAPTIKQFITKNFHPWFNKKKEGFDLLEAKAASESDLTEFIKQKESEFWHVWICDNTGKIQVAMYKPQNAESEWVDDPKTGEVTYLTANTPGI